jgi:hypothetical protein
LIGNRSLSFRATLKRLAYNWLSLGGCSETYAIRRLGSPGVGFMTAFGRSFGSLTAKICHFDWRNRQLHNQRTRILA